MDIDKQSDIKKLNEFLSNELSAVETYGQCIDKTTGSPIAQSLRELRQSHSTRVAQLRTQITGLGGEPVDGSGVWGSFAKMMEGGAKMFSEKSALAMLEEGEDKGLSEYRNDVDKLSASCRSLVEGTLLPEQQRSHDQLRRLIGQHK